MKRDSPNKFQNLSNLKIWNFSEILNFIEKNNKKPKQVVFGKQNEKFIIFLINYAGKYAG